MKKTNSLVVIQSRFNSTRLPGKAIFTIQGFPLVVLAAKRAGNTGKKVIIATSDQHTDDEIALCAEKYGVECVRGSLDDTLARFAKTVEGYPAETIVFRLTADNIIPDGAMLDEMKEQYLRSGAEYMICDNIGSNVPYGISAEIMRVKHIQEAHKNASSEYEREHVTPYIRNKYRPVSYKPFNKIGLSNFRCTIDTFDDYISLKNIFTPEDDLINIPARELINRFNKLLFKPNFEKAVKPMVLGGVQFGLNYGITNTNGKSTQKEITSIIKQAISEGVEYIDTASAYGDSEIAIGKALKGGWAERVKVITKTPPFTELSGCNDPLVYAYATQASVYRSCMNLSISKLDVVMLHRASHLEEMGGVIFKELLKFKGENKIGALGVSVQNPEELELAIKFKDIEFIQLPYNILDYRWSRVIESILAVKKQRRLIIHARSSLLQGLLQSNDQKTWSKAHVKNHQSIYKWLERMRKTAEKMTIADLCIGYVNSHTWVDAVVIGVDNMSQLFRNTQSISMPFIKESVLTIIEETKPSVPEITLNPATWTVK
ncbi:Spore coat polysaccharide biosynthesis protein SpsF, cytidylyltransferase family [Kosakonia radicincitans]|uniref:aldo/keto reductase n=1 Tax=Kosakonia radicincitans TaxID=283686 RepID=UPI0009A74EFD|nr:aldo/keto reductase [Kosakonia radicincitans]SKC22710.1 Spore coat polysaccharide biosynthesis protein SpsF, cytidylyltransferase family [Kosakonia radicincitans]